MSAKRKFVAGDAVSFLSAGNATDAVFVDGDDECSQVLIIAAYGMAAVQVWNEQLRRRKPKKTDASMRKRAVLLAKGGAA